MTYCLKAIVKRVHINEIGENIWGGLPQMQQCDMFDEKDCELIMSWWDIAIITSPNTKDIKRKQTSINDFWLQEFYC